MTGDRHSGTHRPPHRRDLRGAAPASWGRVHRTRSDAVSVSRILTVAGAAAGSSRQRFVEQIDKSGAVGQLRVVPGSRD
jgi:hypothetical protein